jgi:hypothetical protein
MSVPFHREPLLTVFFGEGLQLKNANSFRSFAILFLSIFYGSLAVVFLFILLVDPYDIIPFSLPIERRIVSIGDRYMYPQIVRSKRFDSLVIGTSTSKLLDPDLLNRLFNVRFANLAMSDARAWEQQTMLDLFVRTVGPPKTLIVGLDGVWCDQAADRHRITFRGFPEWLYDERPWKGFHHLLNFNTLEIAGRLVGYHLGLYPERIRYDGYDRFVPPESEYDPVRAHNSIWLDASDASAAAQPRLSFDERNLLAFPALTWLDKALERLPSSQKILSFMPVHIAAQPIPGTRDADIENDCKARITMIGRKYGATVVDWRINSAITRNDANYWDRLHYRVPVATRIAEEIATAAKGKNSDDANYVLANR